MMYPFDFHAPRTIDDARAAFGQAEDAAFVSGGHTLLPSMKNRLFAPSDLIHLTNIPELYGISLDSDRLSIGAAQTHAEVASSELVRQSLPVLAALAGSIGDPQVRHRGTLGGSVANNDPSADYPAAVLALQAEIQTNERRIPADDYFAGLYTTVLEPGEIIIRITFRIPANAGYAKMRNPASRYALAAAFVARHDDGVRVGITGVGVDGAFRWRDAESALDGRFDTASMDGISLPSDLMSADMHASQEYRAHLGAIATRRAVENQGRLTYL